MTGQLNEKMISIIAQLVLCYYLTVGSAANL